MNAPLLTAELFPTAYRGAGAALATALGHALGFVVVKTFVDLRAALALPGALWVYAAAAAAGALFASVVPETKGRSLDDIQREMKNGLW